jgi:DUF3047 family protein
VTPMVHRCRAPVLSLLVVALLALGAGPGSSVRVDDWDSQPIGPLDLSAVWHRYPEEPTAFKRPPAVVLDEGRRVLQLETDGEAMRIGRAVRVELDKTPWLVWEWKAMMLPVGGDVRNPERNDQAARVMVVFEGMRGIQYVWDTTAPTGIDVEPEDLFSIFKRILVVVRSGPGELGRWSRERRNVHDDYQRLFGVAPPPIKLIGVESHSDDTHSRTAVRFGTVQFEPR